MFCQRAFSIPAENIGRRGFVPAFNKDIKLKVTYLKDRGSYAAWKATKTTGQFDLKTFEVRAIPMENMNGLRPGMSVIIEK